MGYPLEDEIWKKCSKCGEWKETKEFGHSFRYKDELNNRCKNCQLEKSRSKAAKYREKNKNQDPATIKKICSTCRIEKLGTEFYSASSHHGGLDNYCKDCANQKSKDNRRSNPAKQLIKYAKKRAKEKNMPFAITEEYIEA